MHLSVKILLQFKLEKEKFVIMDIFYFKTYIVLLYIYNITIL